jgi:hypothetical protein
MRLNAQRFQMPQTAIRRNEVVPFGQRLRQTVEAAGAKNHAGVHMPPPFLEGRIDRPAL